MDMDRDVGISPRKPSAVYLGVGSTCTKQIGGAGFGSGGAQLSCETEGVTPLQGVVRPNAGQLPPGVVSMVSLHQLSSPVHP